MLSRQLSLHLLLLAIETWSYKTGLAYRFCFLLCTLIIPSFQSVTDILAFAQIRLR